MLEGIIEDLLNERLKSSTSYGHLTKQDRLIILRGLALRKSVPEIDEDLSLKWREEGRKRPSKSLRDLVNYYARQYADLIEECAKLYQDQAIRNWRLADKFTRVRVLDRLGNMADNWIVENKHMFYDDEQFPAFRSRALFLIKVLEVLNREMGSVRIVKKEVVHKREVTLKDLVQLGSDPESRAAVEKTIAAEYGDRLGISEAEVIEE